MSPKLIVCADLSFLPLELFFLLSTVIKHCYAIPNSSPSSESLPSLSLFHSSIFFFNCALSTFPNGLRAVFFTVNRSTCVFKSGCGRLSSSSLSESLRSPISRSPSILIPLFYVKLFSCLAFHHVSPFLDCF